MQYANLNFIFFQRERVCVSHLGFSLGGKCSRRRAMCYVLAYFHCIVQWTLSGCDRKVRQHCVTWHSLRAIHCYVAIAKARIRIFGLKVSRELNWRIFRKWVLMCVMFISKLFRLWNLRENLSFSLLPTKFSEHISFVSMLQPRPANVWHGIIIQMRVLCISCMGKSLLCRVNKMCNISRWNMCFYSLLFNNIECELLTLMSSHRKQKWQLFNEIQIKTSLVRL